MEKYEGPLGATDQYTDAVALRVPPMTPLFQSRGEIDIYMDLCEKGGWLYGKGGYLDELNKALKLQAERTRILNQARLEARRGVMGTRETLMASALEMAARRLGSLAASPAYPALLRRLTQEAVARLGTPGQLRLRVRSYDVALMCSLVEEMGLAATVEGNLESEASPWGCLGGVVVATPDERISLANTLAARLQRVASLYRSDIAALVCGHGSEG